MAAEADTHAREDGQRESALLTVFESAVRQVSRSDQPMAVD